MESRATVPYQRPPFIYGEILSRSLCETDRPELPGSVRFLSQGAAIGAFIGFLLPLCGMIANPHGYNFLLIFVLPFSFSGGIAIGLLQGLGMWACTRLARHPLGRATRAILGVLIFALFLVAWYLIVPSSREDKTGTLRLY